MPKRQRGILVTMEVDCPQFESVIPITLTRQGKQPEVCGSGVMTRPSEGEVMFTAAHVLDLNTEGELCAPCGERFMPLAGDNWRNEAPGGNRENDLLDIGYVVFSPRTHEPACIRHLALNDIERDELIGGEHNAYTIVGFPFRKTERRRVTINTAQQRYTGSGLTAQEMKKYGLDHKVHIAINFHRQKSSHGPSDMRQIAPHPRGMSGGGIFAWPKSLRGLKEMPKRYPLVGIFHTYDSKRCLMIDTKIEFLLAALGKHSPHG